MMSSPMQRTATRVGLVALVSATFVAFAMSPVFAKAPEAPFGDKVSRAIVNYKRASPHIGTSGAYGAAAVAEVKALGFTAVLDLRSQGENGAAPLAQAAKAAGLKYYNIPVTTKAPTDQQVAEFAKIAKDVTNYPLLVNCQSANRVGAMWALYRATDGVAPKVAVEEGRTVGLKPSRENEVRRRLGLPPLTK